MFVAVHYLELSLASIWLPPVPILSGSSRFHCKCPASLLDLNLVGTVICPYFEICSNLSSELAKCCILKNITLTIYILHRPKVNAALSTTGLTSVVLLM